jgi:hypothetical protein
MSLHAGFCLTSRRQAVASRCIEMTYGVGSAATFTCILPNGPKRPFLRPLAALGRLSGVEERKTATGREVITAMACKRRGNRLAEKSSRKAVLCRV